MPRISTVSVLFAAALFAQTDPLAEIRKALMGKYVLTVASADKTIIVKQGSILTLKKSDLLAGDVLARDVTSAMVLSSSYKYGKITRGLISQMARTASGTRTFVAGERLSVIDIETKPKSVTFSLLSEEYSGTRYRASLSFPFQNTPSSADAVSLVGEVFDCKAFDIEEPVSAGPGRPIETKESSTRGDRRISAQADPAPAQETGNWNSRYGRITKEDLERIHDPTVLFDLNYLRLNPAALDQKPVMQYFAALSNCSNRDVERASFNELEYPALAAFYRAKAPQILASLPRVIRDVAFDRFIGGQQSGNWRLWTQHLTLGEYDSKCGTFPLKYPGKDVVEIPSAMSTDSGRRNFSQSCPAAQKAARLVPTYLPAQYEITVQSAAYRELAMDEVSARQYIDRAGADRSVFLAVDVAILDRPPVIDQVKGFIAKASFQAQVLRLRVIDSQTQKPLGALFDDGSLRAELPAQTPPPPPVSGPKQSSEWAFTDHMYDIRMSVYVFLAADACGWPLTDEQRANLTHFLDQVSKNGNFNERYQYNLVHSKIKNSIAAQGRMNYCANASERRDFNNYAGMVSPLGPLAKSGSK